MCLPYALHTGSDEEKEDILAAYSESEGSLNALFENVMCSNVLDDEERFIDIINKAIKDKLVSTFPQWKKDIKDTKARNRRKEDAKNEAKEAEELAKELGVHDKIFGDDKDGKKAKNASKTKGKNKASGNVNDEGVDEDALKAVIQSRNSKQNSMNSLIERLEAKYGAADGDPFASNNKKNSKKGEKGGKASNDDNKGASSSGKNKRNKNEEPTEEEFEALQKKLFGRGNDSNSYKKKGKENGAEDSPPAVKKLRRAK